MFFGNEIIKEFVFDDIFGNLVCIYLFVNYFIVNYDCWIDLYIYVLYNNFIILIFDDFKTLVYVILK